MPITDVLVVPDDVTIEPVSALPEALQRRLAAPDGSFAISRRGGRASAKVISSDGARLLLEFRTGKRVAEAVAAFGKATGVDPAGVLIDAFPLLRDCFNARFLLPATAAEALRASQTFERGDRIGTHTVVRCVHVLEDTELYQMLSPSGPAALKWARPAATTVADTLAHEAAILEHVAGAPAPRLLERGTHRDRPYLLVEWRAGTSPLLAAAEARELPRNQGRATLLELVLSVVEAYAALHEKGVVHGDVHPGNVLVGPAGQTTVLDFGLARGPALDGPESQAVGGVGYFLDPSRATELLAGAPLPAPTLAGERYAVAALCYLLATGHHYLDFSLDRDTMLRQIAADAPLPFVRRGIEPWPALETVLTTALEKNPARRYGSLTELLAALREVAPDGDPASPPPADWSVAVDRTLARLEPTAALPKPTASVMHGAAGIAYGLYRLACAGGNPAHLSAADCWLRRAEVAARSRDAFIDAEGGLTPQTLGTASPFHSETGLMCVRALISQALGDVAGYGEAVARFTAHAPPADDALDLTTGVAGTLLACAALREARPHGTPLDDAFGAVAHDLLARACAALRDAQLDDRLGKLGMAHGWAGLLFAMLRWCHAAGSPVPADVEVRLQELASRGEPIGRGMRWPVSAVRGQDEIYHAGWCNGSAGFAQLFAYAASRGYSWCTEPAIAAAWNVWETPAVAPHLCCGAAGGAYGLLSVYRLTGESPWLQRAADVATRAIARMEATITLAARPLSLFKGSVGIAVLAADLNAPERSAMPFVEGEGWN